MATYGGALSADFVFDDHLFLKHHCWQIEHLSELLDVPSAPGCGYRRVRYLSLAVDHALWGLDPVGYHLTNLLLHAAVLLLLFALLLRLTGDPLAASMATLIWGLHPVHTDVVTYVAGRRDLLAALLLLLAYAAWPRSRGRPLRSTVRVLLVVACFALGFESKEAVVTLPALLVLEMWLRPAMSAVRQDQPAPSMWRILNLGGPRLLALGLVVLVAGAAVLYRGVLFPMTTTGRLWGGNLGTHVLTVLAVHAKYVELIFAPFNLYGDYLDYPLATAVSDPRVWIGGLFLASLWGLGLGLARRAPYLAFGLLWLAVNLLPVSHIIPHHELRAEHYLYIPLMGLTVPLARALSLARARSRAWPTVQAGVVAVAALSVVLVSDRNRDFQTERAFAEAVLRQVPHSIRGHLTLAHAMQVEGELGRAAANLEWVMRQIEGGGEVAERARRFHHTTRENLATTYAALGDLERAAQQASAMIREYPDDSHGYRILGTVAALQGRLDEALRLHQRAVEVEPNDVESHLHLGITLLRIERVQDAKPHIAFAVERWRRNPDVRLQWAMVAFMEGDLETARQRLLDVAQMDPGNPLPIEQLIQLEMQAGNAERACALYWHLRTLRPDLENEPPRCPRPDGAPQ